MNLKWLAAVAVVAGLAAWAFWPDSRRAPADESASTPSGRAVNGTSAGSSGVQGVGPGTNSVRPAAAGSAVVPVKVSLANDFATARSYKALYDRLHGTPEGQTGDGLYVLQRILRACATVTGSGGRPIRTPRTMSEEQRQSLVTSIPDSDPNKARRLAAIERISEDKCVGLTGLVTTEAELGQMLKNAAAAGSPAARAAAIEAEMWAERRSSDNRRPTLSDAQIDQIKESFSSRDPEAILAAGRVLANNFRDLSVRIGPDQVAAESRALQNAFTIAACNYGYACGDNNSRILNACAYQGHCEAGNLPDFIQYYGASPHDAYLQQQYVNALRGAIETGDWSAITFFRGPTGPTQRFLTSNPPGLGPR